MLRLTAIALLVSAMGSIAQCDPNTVFANTTTNEICTEVIGGVWCFYSNSLPDHSTGAFPNPNNLNSISSQELSLSMCAYPQMASDTTWLDQGSGSCPFWEFGIAVNGIIIDPIAAEFFENPNNGQLNTDWNENALSSNINLGLDTNDAHVQPSGKYHYHDDPRGMIAQMGISSSTHSPIVAYAADGFPVYYKYVYQDPTDMQSAIVEVNSCYILRSGNRPGDGTSAPDGPYDGTYTQDYRYDTGVSCDLDPCNGRYGKTPEYPNGTYYYVITEDFPVIPRCLMGEPDMVFTIGPPFQGCGISNASSICSNSSITDLNSLAEEISFFPNPAVSELQINTPESLVLSEIRLIDANGQVVEAFLGDRRALAIEEFSAGIYYIQFVHREGRMTK